MVDIRRALPTVPAALCLGTAAGSAVAPLSPAALGSHVPAPSALGLVAIPLTAVFVYRTLSGWPERSRRQLGYACSVVVGAGFAAFCAFMALGTSFCATWGEQCSPAQEAAIGRWGTLSVVSLVAIPALYAAADVATREAMTGEVAG